MNLKLLDANERLALIRFCLEHGTKIQLSTRGLLCPLVMVDLENAFQEREAEISQKIKNHEKALKDYRDGKLILQPWLIEFLGGNPDDEIFENYIDGCIKQLRELNIREEFSIHVYTKHTREELEFHKNMNPKVTFGYSSILHEQCETQLNEKIIKQLIPCFADINEQEQNETNESSSYGRCRVGSIYYEDLIICKNSEIILSTISHAKMFDINLSESYLSEFIKFENTTDRNK